MTLFPYFFNNFFAIHLEFWNCEGKEHPFLLIG